MSMSSVDMSGLTNERLEEFREQFLAANREALRMCLDAYEQTLEAIASYQEQAASQTDVDWISSAAKAQARFTRELAKRQLELGRELLMPS